MDDIKVTPRTDDGTVDIFIYNPGFKRYDLYKNVENMKAAKEEVADLKTPMELNDIITFIDQIIKELK